MTRFQKNGAIWKRRARPWAADSGGTAGAALLLDALTGLVCSTSASAAGSASSPMRIDLGASHYNEDTIIASVG